MVTAVDHIENLRKQLLDKKRGKELELEEINEMIRVLGQAPKVLRGESIHASSAEERQDVGGAGPRKNPDFSKHVRDYIASAPYEPETISIGVMVKELTSRGLLKGKPRSLYAHASSVMKELAEKHEFGLRHDESGYFRSRKLDTDRTDSVLVHSS